MGFYFPGPGPSLILPELSTAFHNQPPVYNATINEEGPSPTMANEFRLVSPGKDHEGRLPRKYTSDGQGALKNISPPLEWYNVPEGTKRLALVVEDIDAPDPDGPIVPWTHWVVANIPPTLKDLPEGFSKKEDEMGGEYAEIKEGNNDWKVPGGAARSCRRRGIGSSSSSMHWMMISCILDMRFRFGYGFLFGSLVTKEKLLEVIKGHVIGEALL
ncbi:unnamed protein product, partial [Ilex paraguariensis]